MRMFAAGDPRCPASSSGPPAELKPGISREPRPQRVCGATVCRPVKRRSLRFGRRAMQRYVLLRSLALLSGVAALPG